MGGAVRLEGSVVQPAWRWHYTRECCIHIWGVCDSTVGDLTGGIEVGNLCKTLYSLSRFVV